MPKEPAAGTTRQPPKRQPPVRTPAAPVQAPVANTSQGELVQRALADPTTLSPAEVAALQQSVGNRAVQRLLARPDPPENPNSGLVVQPKLVVGPANDAYEREADQVAQGVMRQISAGAPDQAVQRAVGRPDNTSINYDDDQEKTSSSDWGPKPAAAPAAASPVGRQRQEEDEPLQRMPVVQPAVGLQGGAVDSSVEGRIHQARGGGAPLHSGLRASMENAFQADFSRVRVHNNRQSDNLNRSLSARAFTTGQDLF